ncbi:hypothetical protein [Acaryochloris sp. CCMEE 5410]|uniref:hypothetical protein n=1 Tax=Acaryochloris sp. CCMEE 5410 TaxID=310037 RepID=UPI0003107077|nr:hypothetical protein [Acaryochloris sp. CCMEE 5410]KAI9132358.1 hypothetical protein ON05_002520 [Acaryochloris sp. CCMEE 5410]
MNRSSLLLSRKDALQILSEERGRSPAHPLDPSLISKWCADLSFEVGLQEFDEEQMAQLRAMNQHYACGGSRTELLEKMRNPEWYQSLN